MRYRHVLSKARGDAMPRAIVAVECDTESLAQEVNSNERRVRLVRWHAYSTLLESGRPGKSRYSAGDDPAGFWESLRWLLNRGGVTWIVSYQCGKHWALLDVWKGVEDGWLHISGSDSRNRSVRGTSLPGLQESVLADGTRGGTGTDSDVSYMPREAADTGGRMGSNTSRGAKAGQGGYLVLEDPPNVMHARVADTTGTVHWVDSRNYGVDCGEPEYAGRERSERLHDFALAMVRTLRERGLGGLRDTAGSQAMSSFRRKHLGHVIVCHTNPDVLSLESSAYYGGRCEAFRLGGLRGPVYHYDFCSLYPSVCASSKLPVRLRCFDDRNASLVARQQRDLLSCVASVTVETESPDYPYRKQGLVVWPVGRFRTCLFGPELAHAAASGRISAWHSIAVYDMEYALRSFALECDDIRIAAKKTGNRELAQWAKRLGVSLPGKFGQKDRRWITVDCPPPFSHYDEWYSLDDDGKPNRWRTIAGVTQYEHAGGFGPDAVPSIAGFITSAGRMRLLRAMDTAGRNNVLYCDTDSLFVSQVGSNRLVESGELSSAGMGRLRLEGVYGECSFRGIKDYAADGRHVCAGLPVGSSSETLDGETYWWRPWIGVATSVHRRPSANEVLKTYRREQPYRHGIVLADGAVEPIRVWE